MAHLCVIHGVHVGSEALIANHATVLDGAVIGARCMIAAGALVVAGTQIPAGMLVTGAPAKVKDRLKERARKCGLTSIRRPIVTWLHGIWPDWNPCRRRCGLSRRQF